MGYKRRKKKSLYSKIIKHGWHIFFATFFIFFNSFELFADLVADSSLEAGTSFEESLEKSWNQTVETYTGTSAQDCAKIQMKNRLLPKDLKDNLDIKDEECIPPKNSFKIGLTDDTNPPREVVQVETKPSFGNRGADQK